MKNGGCPDVKLSVKLALSPNMKACEAKCQTSTADRWYTPPPYLPTSRSPDLPTSLPPPPNKTPPKKSPKIKIPPKPRQKITKHKYLLRTNPTAPPAGPGSSALTSAAPPRRPPAPSRATRSSRASPTTAAAVSILY